MATFSATEIMGWLRCRYQHDFSSFNSFGLTPVITASYFSLGTCVHLALADWALSPTDNLANIYMGHALRERQSMVDSYKSRVGMEPTDGEMRKTDKSLEDGMAMMLNYQAYYKTPLAEGWRPVIMEQTFTVPIPSTPHFLECTVDGIITNDIQFAILENKTYSRHPNPDMLYRNFQFKSYTWAFLAAGVGSLLGLAYNGLWTKRAVPTGRTWADMFHREIVTFSEDQLLTYQNDLVNIVTEMSSNPQLYPHVPWDGCRCSYKELCDLRMAGKPWQAQAIQSYKLREKTPAWMDKDED